MVESTTTPDVDAVIVGAGFSGLYMLHHLRKMGLTAQVIEAGSDVGGTWYWNRYPGARSDSDSIFYCFSDLFDKETLNEWRWSERYPTQREIQSYLGWVADRFDLRSSINFSSKVVEASYSDETRLWTVQTDTEQRIRTRYFIPAVGALSKPNVPSFAGLEDFAGQWFHTARLPEEGVDYAGKRVAVIGNGATAVQIVPEIAHEAARVHLFSRNPGHCLPGRNHVMDDEDWELVKAQRKEMWEKARGNIAGFAFAGDIGPATDFDTEKIQEVFEDCWRRGGLWLANSSFSDLILSEETNQLYLDFLAEKIRTLVRDPELAEKLIPTQPFLSKRPPVEHGYYSSFNRENVQLVDLRERGIAEIIPSGIRMTDGTEYRVDLILFATGFDAHTGALLDMNISGRRGYQLSEKWAEKPKNYLGMLISEFPNLFMLYCGPYDPAILTNGPSLIELQGEWIATCIGYAERNRVIAIEPLREAEDAYVQLCEDIGNATLIPRTASWWTGGNVGDGAPMVRSWIGGLPEYRGLLDDAANDYAQLTLMKG